MPKGGYAEVKRGAAKLRAQLPKDIKNLRDLMRVQDAWLLSFFSLHAPRLINDVTVGSGGTNTITKKDCQRMKADRTETKKQQYQQKNSDNININNNNNNNF